MKAYASLSCFVILTSLSAVGGAQTVPHLISFSGHLADAGAPVTGAHDLTFELFDSTGNPACGAWSETHSAVTIDAGLVFVELGADTPLDTSCFDGSSLFLEVTVDTTTLTPRISIGTAAYAIRAEVAGDAATVGGMLPTDIFPVGTNLTCGGTDKVTGIDATSGDVICAGDEFEADTNTNAGTLCGVGEYLDGDGTCKTVSTMTDTNAETICGTGQYLNGDGGCDTGFLDADGVDAYNAAYDTEAEIDAAVANNNYSTGSHTTDTHAGTICAAGQFLNGDGTCDSVPVDTSVVTLCGADQFLDGDGTCMGADGSGNCATGTVCVGGHSHSQYVTTDTNTNAGTICAAGQFLNGDGTCDPVPVDTNTNAQTICASGTYLRGDGSCNDIGPHRLSGTVGVSTYVTLGAGADRGQILKIVWGERTGNSIYSYFTGMANDGNTAIKGFVLETGSTVVRGARIVTTSTTSCYTSVNGYGRICGSGTFGTIRLHNLSSTQELFYVATFGPASDGLW